MSAPIDEAVGLLAEFSPDKLQELRKRYPGHDKLLRPGMVAGQSDPLLVMRAEVCAVACQESAALCDRVIQVTQSRLTRASNLQYASQVMTLIANGAVLALLQVTHATEATYIGAGLAFLSSLVTLGIQYSTRSLHPTGQGAAEVFSDLLGTKPEADRIESHLRLWLKSGADDKHQEGIEDLIGRGNELSAKVYRTIHLIPGITTAKLRNSPAVSLTKSFPQTA